MHSTQASQLDGMESGSSTLLEELQAVPPSSPTPTSAPTPQGTPISGLTSTPAQEPCPPQEKSISTRPTSSRLMVVAQPSSSTAPAIMSTLLETATHSMPFQVRARPALTRTTTSQQAGVVFLPIAPLDQLQLVLSVFLTSAKPQLQLGNAPPASLS